MLAVAAVGAWTFVSPPPAAAQSPSLTLSTPSTIGVTGKAITVRESGFAISGDNFVFVYLQATATPCATTEEADAALPNVSEVDYDEIGYGPFDHLNDGSFVISPAPGVYRLCGYLNPDDLASTDPNASPPDATATVVLGASAGNSGGSSGHGGSSGRHHRGGRHHHHRHHRHRGHHGR